MASTDTDDDCVIDSRWRLILLYELANLVDTGMGKFWRSDVRKKLLRHYLSDDDLLSLRGEVQKFWNPNVPLDEKNAVLAAWLRPGPVPELNPFLPKFKSGAMQTNPSNIRVTLAVAILYVAQIGCAKAHSLMAFFGYCENPDCAARYFIKMRRTDKYCGSEDCKTYASTKRQGKWWRNSRSKSARERHRTGKR